MTGLAHRWHGPHTSGAAVWLADDLYFMVHDDHTGRPQLHPRAVQLGLAAALLGELMLADRITVQSGRIYVRSRQPPPDALAHTILDRLIGQQPHSDLRTELSVIAAGAAEAVAHRLERGGLVHYVQTRRLTRTTGQWVPTDPNQAAWRTARLRQLLSGRDEVTWHDVILAALLSAVGATGRALRDADPQARVRLKAIMSQLPASVAELVSHTEAAVGNAILAQRR
jgi:Golgi phosphoprotein 3 (GPP34)